MLRNLQAETLGEMGPRETNSVAVACGLRVFGDSGQRGLHWFT